MRRILIVDDEAPVARALMRLLRRAGFEVEVASDGADALGKLAGFDADVVLTDYRMPGMSGRELLERVRARGLHAARVVLSGHVELDALTEDPELCHEVLNKPWEDDRLVGILRALAADDLGSGTLQ